MSTAVPEGSHFLVEWYRPDVAEQSFDQNLARLADCAASMSADGAPVRLLVRLAVPADEVAFAVFDAISACTVARVCDLAGIPAQRLTPAVNACFSSGKDGGTPDVSRGRHR